MSDIPQKHCIGPCGRTLDATPEYWHRKKNGKYGLKAMCKECANKDNKVYYERPEVKARASALQKERNAITEVRERKLKKKRVYDKEYHALIEVKRRKSDYAKDYRSIPEVKGRLQKYQKRYEKEHYKKHRDIPEFREARRINKHNRRARQKSIGGTYTPKQIQDQLKRQKHKCYYAACGHSEFKKINGKYQYHIEHTFPISRVADMDIPANSIDYLVLSCPTCNLSKGDKFPWEWSEGGRLL
jgi:hypothetical protein